MSIFDTISNGITSLFDDPVGTIGDALTSGTDLNGLVGSAVKGYSNLQKESKQRLNDEQSLISIIERNSRLQPTDQEFKAHPNKQYGAGNYSADSENISQAWRQYLLGVSGNSKVVPGERYTGVGVA